MPHTTMCLERIEELQARISERDKTILEQQARIAELVSVLDKLARLGNDPNYEKSFIVGYARAALGITNLSALAAHDAELTAKVRKETLEECYSLLERAEVEDAMAEIERMAEEGEGK